MICPDCGAVLPDESTCEDQFHTMLFWEAEVPSRGVVHHLMVLCYHLQHPRLYSPEGLAGGLGLLTDFVVRGVTTVEARAHRRDTVDSGKRTWTITARAGAEGRYAHPVEWTMRAVDVTDQGADRYVESVEAWARSVYDALAASGNL